MCKRKCVARESAVNRPFIRLLVPLSVRFSRLPPSAHALHSLHPLHTRRRREWAKRALHVPLGTPYGEWSVRRVNGSRRRGKGSFMKVSINYGLRVGWWWVEDGNLHERALEWRWTWIMTRDSKVIWLLSRSFGSQIRVRWISLVILLSLLVLQSYPLLFIIEDNNFYLSVSYSLSIFKKLLSSIISILFLISWFTSFTTKNNNICPREAAQSPYGRLSPLLLSHEIDGVRKEKERLTAIISSALYVHGRAAGEGRGSEGSERHHKERTIWMESVTRSPRLPSPRVALSLPFPPEGPFHPANGRPFGWNGTHRREWP